MVAPWGRGRWVGSDHELLLQVAQKTLPLHFVAPLRSPWIWILCLGLCDHPSLPDLAPVLEAWGAPRAAALGT